MLLLLTILNRPESRSARGPHQVLGFESGFAAAERVAARQRECDVAWLLHGRHALHSNRKGKSAEHGVDVETCGGTALDGCGRRPLLTIRSAPHAAAGPQFDNQKSCIVWMSRNTFRSANASEQAPRRRIELEVTIE